MKKFIAVLLCLFMLTGCGSKTALGIVSKRYAAGADMANDGRAETKTTCCALTLDDKGKVLDISIDMVKSHFDFDSKGVITNDIAEEVFTNKELKDDAGYKRNSKLNKEWYEQAEAFENWAMGKNIIDVLNAANEEQPEEGKGEPLSASVDMDLTDILEAVQKAYIQIQAQNEENNSRKNKSE